MPVSLFHTLVLYMAGVKISIHVFKNCRKFWILNMEYSPLVNAKYPNFTDTEKSVHLPLFLSAPLTDLITSELCKYKSLL